jgi:hypothetical protein
MAFFDYVPIAREAGISDEILQVLSEKVRRDFPKDDMLYELRMMRACMAVRDGHVRREDLCKDETTSSSA